MIRYYRGANCGKKGIDQSTTQQRRFCSKECGTAYRNKKRYPANSCKFNEGVVCGDNKCKSCNWNPEVAAQKRKTV